MNMNITPLDVDTMVAKPLGDNTNNPWSSVGVDLPENATVAETLIAAKLDWDVVKRPVWVDGTPVSEMIDERVLSKREAPSTPTKVAGNYVLLRADTMTPVSPFVGARYKPIQNADAFEVFRDFCDAGNMTMETAGSLLGGEHIWGLAKIKGEYELCNGEFLRGYFLLMQSHVYGSSLKAMFTPIRYPGGHMMVQAIGRGRTQKKTYTMPHSRHFNQSRIAEIKEVMGVAESVMVEYVADARSMADATVDDATTIRFFINQFHPDLAKRVEAGLVKLPKHIGDLSTWEHSNFNLRKVPDLLESYAGADLVTCKGTAWGLVQATNHFYDHHTGRSTDTRLISSWIGPNAKKKLAALSAAKQF